MWIIVCPDCLDIERSEFHGGADPPGLEPVPPSKTGLRWAQILAVLSFGPHTTKELVAATGLTRAVVQKHLTAHRDTDVRLVRQGERCEWERLDLLEELKY